MLKSSGAKSYDICSLLSCGLPKGVGVFIIILSDSGELVLPEEKKLPNGDFI